MKKNSRLSRYKDPYKQMEMIHKHNLKTYRSFTFRLHKINDKEMIKEIDNRTVSLPDLIKSWYKNSK